MKYGVKNAEDKRIRYDQTNNIVERFLLDLKGQGETKFYLESCNVEASACSVEGVGAKWKLPLPKHGGTEIYGYGDLLFFFLYSTYGQRFAPVVGSHNENEVIRNLAFALNELAFVSARVIPFTVEDMHDALKHGEAIVISYLTDYGTGHFITVVQFDTDKKVFRCYDPWAGNLHCKKGGVLEEYDEKFFQKRARPVMMTVKGVLV